MKHLGLTIILIAIAGFISCGVNEKVKKHMKAHEDADYIMNNLDQPDIVKKFPAKYFPANEFQPLLTSLQTNCDIKNMRGKFVDFYSMLNNGKQQTSFIYEYIFNCDSLRFIYTYDLDPEVPELFSFRVEGIEVKNPMIIDPSKQLLNTKTQ